MTDTEKVRESMEAKAREYCANMEYPEVGYQVTGFKAGYREGMEEERKIHEQAAADLAQLRYRQGMEEGFKQGAKIEETVESRIQHFNLGMKEAAKVLEDFCGKTSRAHRDGVCPCSHAAAIREKIKESA